MKSFIALLVFLSALQIAQAQNSSDDSLLSEISGNACLCIDSIATTGKAKTELSREIEECITKQVVVWQFGSKLSAINEKKKKRKKEKIELDLGGNPNSKEFKKYYFEIERYLVSNCNALKGIMHVDNTGGANTFSKNSESIKFYTAGLDDLTAERYEQAVTNFKAALAIDSLFSFAWDNLGISYRRLRQYPAALEAYQKSIAVFPGGKTPWQNIAVVYEYQKEYQKAIEAYERLAELDKENPEVYYGIGRICALYTKEYEKGLHNLCIAYNLYVKQGSPYRTDAEKVINVLFGEMKKEGHEKRFGEILKEHNINMN